MDHLEKYIEFGKVLLPAAVVAMVGSFVKFLREHRDEPFSWGEFLSGMAIAAFVGVVVQCLCNGLGLSSWTSTAVVAMAGYGGGTTLDLILDTMMKRAGK